MMDMVPFNLVFFVFFMSVAASETQELSKYHSSDSLVKHLVYRLAEDVQQIKKDHKEDITTLKNDLKQDMLALQTELSDVLQKLKSEKGSCPDWFTGRHKSSCYHFVPAKVNWMTANARCRMSGAQLVSIETQEENAYIRNFLKKMPLLTAHNFWTSGTDAAEEGRWFWTGSGKYMSYSDWHPGQGDSTSCLILWTATGWNWHDHTCALKEGYICELSL